MIRWRSGRALVLAATVVLAAIVGIVTAGCAAPQPFAVPVTTLPVTSLPVTSRPVTSLPLTSLPVTTLPRSSEPTSSPPPTARLQKVRVSGIAQNSAGAAFKKVEIGFQQLSCTDCPAQATATDDAGRYQVSLLPGNYLVVCVATPFDCTLGDTASNNEKVDITTDTTVDVLVSGETDPPTSSPPPNPVPEPAQSSLSGYVRTNEGKPVPGIDIVLRPPGTGGGSLHTTTGADGSYSFDNLGTVYNALCVTPNPDYECGPVGGDGTDNPIDGSKTGQKMDFILCRSTDYPQCLQR